MKVALVYTSTTPELVELVEREVGDVPPRETEVTNYQDPSILAEIRDAGYMTAPLAARLADTYMTAVSGGADAILNLYFSVGEVTDAAQDIARYTEISIVRVGEGMCREAVRQRKRIGVTATLPTTLSLAKNTILGVAREMNCQVELMDVLVGGSFGLDQEQFRGLMSEHAGTITDKVDVILFTRDSMTYCEEYIHEKYSKVVLSSSRFSVAALKDVLVKKGLM